jgi:hypothetical protein
MSASVSIFSFLANYKKVLRVLLPAFFLVMFIVLRVSLAKDKAETDFLSARLAYEVWEEGEGLDTVYLANLKTYIKKHPELSQRFENPMLQRFIAQGETKLSVPLIEKALGKVIEKPSYYDRFGRASLLITNGLTEKALNESLLLKNDLILDSDFWRESQRKHRGSVLFAFNLLRVAMLYQSLHKTNEEYAAWREFKRYAKWEEGETSLDTEMLDPYAFALLENHFKDQALTLRDYIHFRERSL